MIARLGDIGRRPGRMFGSPVVLEAAPAREELPTGAAWVPARAGFWEHASSFSTRYSPVGVEAKPSLLGEL